MPATGQPYPKIRYPIACRPSDPENFPMGLAIHRANADPLWLRSDQVMALDFTYREGRNSVLGTFPVYPVFPLHLLQEIESWCREECEDDYGEQLSQARPIRYFPAGDYSYAHRCGLCATSRRSIFGDLAHGSIWQA